MIVRTYSDRELACAHLRKILGLRPIARFVSPDASEITWRDVQRVMAEIAPHIIRAVVLLAECSDDEAARALAHDTAAISSRDPVETWREWVQRECAAELDAITAPKTSQSLVEQPAPAEVHITPTLTFAEFVRIALALRGSQGSVSVEMFNDGTVKIDGTRIGGVDGDVTAALVGRYRANVTELRRRADSARIEADALDAILAKAVTP